VNGAADAIGAGGARLAATADHAMDAPNAATAPERVAQGNGGSKRRVVTDGALAVEWGVEPGQGLDVASDGQNTSRGPPGPDDRSKPCVTGNAFNLEITQPLFRAAVSNPADPDD